MSGRSCSLCTWQIYSDSSMEWSYILVFMRTTPKYTDPALVMQPCPPAAHFNLCRPHVGCKQTRLQLNTSKVMVRATSAPRISFTYQTYLSSLALTRYSRWGACGISGYTSTATYPWGVMSQRLSQTVSPPFADSEVSVDWSVSWSLVTSLIMTQLYYGSVTLISLPVLNSATRLICYAQKYDHVTHLQVDDWEEQLHTHTHGIWSMRLLVYWWRSIPNLPKAGFNNNKIQPQYSN